MSGQHRVVQYMAAWLQQHVSTVNDSGKSDWGDSGRTGMPRRRTEGHSLLVSGHQNGGRTVKSGLQKVQSRTGRGGAAVGTGDGPFVNDGMGSAAGDRRRVGNAHPARAGQDGSRPTRLQPIER